MNELAESIQPEMFCVELFKHVQVTTLQRLGYILENTLENNLLADTLYKALQQQGITFFRTPLKTSAPRNGYTTNERWKVIENTEIEIDD